LAAVDAWSVTSERMTNHESQSLMTSAPLPKVTNLWLIWAWKGGD